MASFTPEEFERAGPGTFKHPGATLEHIITDYGTNTVLQAAILQPAPPDPDVILRPSHITFQDMDWSVVTAVRGPGRSEGVVSTPTKNIPEPTALALAKSVRADRDTWSQVPSLNEGIEDPKAFYVHSSSPIADARDVWHVGPNYQDLLANEVSHLLSIKFPDLAPQIHRNHLAGVPSFMCRQVRWIGGFSADLQQHEEDETVEVLNLEPNVMIGVLVIANSNLSFDWVNTGNSHEHAYTATGTTPLSDFVKGMGTMGVEGAQLLAPYAMQDAPARSLMSMCTEVTNSVIDQIGFRRELKNEIPRTYYDRMPPPEVPYDSM
jgi:hypothetical protein